MSSKQSINIQQKRLFPRRELRSKIIFEDEFGEGFIYFYSTDVSLGGLFIESDIPLKIGTKVFLSFKLHDADKPLQATGEIVRIEKGRGSSFTTIGMGVRFLGISDKVLSAIGAYISR